MITDHKLITDNLLITDHQLTTNNLLMLDHQLTTNNLLITDPQLATKNWNDLLITYYKLTNNDHNLTLNLVTLLPTSVTLPKSSCPATHGK